jgi:hypothetical protein
VYRDTGVLREYRCTGEVQLRNGSRRSTGVVQAYSCSTVLV